MQRNEIYDMTVQVIKGECACADFDGKSLLKQDLGFDSLSLVALIVRLEEKFGIVFDDSDIDPDAITDVDSIVRLVEKTL